MIVRRWLPYGILYVCMASVLLWAPAVWSDASQLGITHFVAHEEFGHPDYARYVRQGQIETNVPLSRSNTFQNLPFSTASDGPVQAFFSERDSLKEKLLEYMRNEQQQIDVAAYILNDKDVAQEMLEAVQRGVRIRIVVDKQVLTGNSSKLDMLRMCPDISIYVYNPLKRGSSTSLMHNKFVLFYAQPEMGPCVWTGSANFTNQALNGKNQENAIFLPSRNVHQDYLDYFEGLIGQTKEQKIKRNIPQ